MDNRKRCSSRATTAAYWPVNSQAFEGVEGTALTNAFEMSSAQPVGALSKVFEQRVAASVGKSPGTLACIIVAHLLSSHSSKRHERLSQRAEYSKALLG